MNAQQQAPQTDEERAEAKMARAWFSLSMAEQRMQPVHVLDRMYDAYLAALDAYVLCVARNRQRLTSAGL